MTYLIVSLPKQARQWRNGAACCLMACLLLIASQGFAQETSDYDDPLPQILPKGAFRTCVQLPAGTPIFLETAEKINAHEATVGQTLLFRVRVDVVVNGAVLIANGTTAIGRVKSLKAGTYNDPAEIVVDLQYALARDGQQIPLFGNEQRFPGDGASLEPGQLLTAQVANTVLIRMP